MFFPVKPRFQACLKFAVLPIKLVIEEVLALSCINKWIITELF
jgi:hypothetical protein